MFVLLQAADHTPDYDPAMGLWRDSRGNRVERWSPRVAAGTEAPVWILVDACEGVARHVEELLEPCRRAPHRIPVDEWDEWTHAFELQGAWSAERERRLNLMSEVLMIPSQPGIDLLFADDFYKVPDNGPSQDWPNSEAGELVKRLKYWVTNPTARIAAGHALADRMADLVRRHPDLRAADVVLPAPISTATGVSEMLGGEVAERLGLPVANARSLESGGAAKAGTDGHARHYEVFEGDLEEADVLIIDDVYRSGGTMRGIASAARDAGALRVFGVVGARTLRN